MITKEQLQAMSDFELDFALKRVIYSSSKIDEQKRQMISCCDNLFQETGVLMDFAFEHLSRIEKVWGKWAAESNSFENIYCYKFESANPLRAIACCLILVLEGEIG